MQGGRLSLPGASLVFFSHVQLSRVFYISWVVSCRLYSYQLDGCLYSQKGKYRRCVKLQQERAEFGLLHTKQIKPEARQVVLETIA